MKPRQGPLWRVFPWDPAAPLGAPFSLTHVQPQQTSGRFDLGIRPAVLYLAESPEHAVGEKLQRFRGRRLTPMHLREYGRTLAIVSVTPAARVIKAVADLTDPEVLHRLKLRPDIVASRDRRRTQAVARRLYEEGYSGLHWWSALTGDWHATILFLDSDRVHTRALTFGQPEPLSLQHPGVVRCFEFLGIQQA
ncbi:MAG: RES family NAD+ phosphorylase [Gemmatimonadales bacterium]